MSNKKKKDISYWKDQAHLYFDKIWKFEMMTRSEAYAWLAGYLNLSVEQTHVSLFDVGKCKQAIEASKMFLNDMRRLDLDFGATPKTEYFPI